MERLGFEALSAFMILLPGFLCARVVHLLYVKPEQTDLDKVIESLIYSFLVYLIFLSAFSHVLPVRLLTQQSQGVTVYDVQLQFKPLAQLAIIATALGLALGGIITNDLTGKLFRKLRITQRTTRSSVWSDAFHDTGGVVQVQLGDGRQLMGWLRYYSDEPKDSSLFLEKAAWVTADSGTIPIHGPGILVTHKLGINWVEFLDRPKLSQKTDSASDATAANEYGV